MKKRFFALLLLILAFTVVLTACDITPADDPSGNDDPPVDVDPTEDEPEKDPSLLYLAEDGAMNYCFVYTAATDTDSAFAVRDIRSKLKSFDLLPNGTESNMSADLEIIVGSGSTRRGCYVDAHTLGEEGWIVKVAGDRIVIAGGNDQSTAAAVNAFYGMLTIDKKAGTITMKKNAELRSEPVYPIKSVTIGGTPIADFKILATQGNDDTYGCALRFREQLYLKAGIWLDVFDLGTNTEHAIVFRLNDAATGTLFRKEEKDGTLYFESASKTAFYPCYELFESEFFAQTGDLTIETGYKHEIGNKVLKYSDFGAVGDGVTDDYDAICRAHLIANETKMKVEADEGATYYIGLTTKTCPICTDVDWKDATFIIDDSVVPSANRTMQIFTVQPTYERKTLSGTSLLNYTLKSGATNVGMTFDSDVLLRLCWKGKKIYIRWGINENAGSDQSEVIVVDKDGNVDPMTPVLWDYDGMDWIRVTRLDETPLTIEGGTFITKANCAARTYAYYSRGILVNRPNVTIKNVVHTVIEEGENGAPYNGFFDASETANVVYENCKVVGHKTYRLETDDRNTMGSYDISSSYSNGITYRNIIQTNDITKPQTELWGVHGSNFNKNLAIYDSSISRFDAHCGMYNCTAVDTTFGQYFNCIGFGHLYAKNVHRISGASFISLRSDYGSTWNGDAEIIDCSSDYAYTSYIFSASYTAGWNFGYTCYLPQNIVIDNFTYAGPACYVFNNVPTTAATDPVNPYQITKTITFRNNKKTIGVCPTKSKDTFKNTKVVYE